MTTRRKSGTENLSKTRSAFDCIRGERARLGPGVELVSKSHPVLIEASEVFFPVDPNVRASPRAGKRRERLRVAGTEKRT